MAYDAKPTEVKARKPISLQILEQKEKSFQESKVYNETDSKYYSFLIKQIENARIQRQTPTKFFDDMTFEQAYISNQNASNSYLQKKKNVEEVRVNTGATEKKIETIWNELIALNVKSKILAFDEFDSENVELGTSLSNLVRRTNQIENDEEFWNEFIHELLTQPAVFTYENYFTKLVYDKRNTGKKGEKLLKYKKSYCKKTVLSGLQVYLGDITKPAYLFQEQPFLVIQEKVTYREAKQIYGDNPNWKYVKDGRTGNLVGLFDYKLMEGVVGSEQGNDEVEIIHYMSAPDDEYNCLVNGVMMFKAGTKLPYEKEGYNVEMHIIKPMSRNFAYGKCLTHSAKYLQSLDNETIRLFIRKFRQSVNPPIGVKRGRIIGKDIFEAGKMSVGITKDSFDKLIDHTGINGNDTAFMEIIEAKIKEFIGTNDLMSGQESSGSQTATEILRLQRQALKMLGLSVSALRRAHEKTDMLRLYNVLENEMTPIKKLVNKIDKSVIEVFKRYSLADADLEDGKKGTYNIQFTNREFGEEDNRQLYLKEKEDELYGKPTKNVFINIENLRKIPLFFYAHANSEPEKTDELGKVLFSEQVNQIAAIQQLTGRKPNSDKMIEGFERTWGVEDAFMDEGQELNNAEADPRLAQMDEQIAQMDQNPDNIPATMMNALKNPETQQPTVNTLAKQ